MKPIRILLAVFVLSGSLSVGSAQDEPDNVPSVFQKDEVDLAVDKAIAFLLSRQRDIADWLTTITYRCMSFPPWG